MAKEKKSTQKSDVETTVGEDFFLQSQYNKPSQQVRLKRRQTDRHQELN